MSIKALDDLRCTATGIEVTVFPTYLRNRILAIADEIEAEITERFMELPVDTEGVPIRMGDTLQLGDTRGEVVALTYCPSNGKLPWEWQCDTGDWYNTAFARHVKPRTLEDVLNDFGARALNSGHQWGLDAQDAITECADEIRAMFGEVDDD